MGLASLILGAVHIRGKHATKRVLVSTIVPTLTLNWSTPAFVSSFTNRVCGLKSHSGYTSWKRMVSVETTHVHEWSGRSASRVIHSKHASYLADLAELGKTFKRSRVLSLDDDRLYR